MTPQQRFEQWLATRGIVPQKTVDGEYSDHDVRVMWEAVQAMQPAEPVVNQSLTAEQEAFEAWFPATRWFDTGRYIHQRDQDRWEGWQARAALQNEQQNIHGNIHDEPVKGEPSDEIDIDDVRSYLASWGCLAHPGVRALLARYSAQPVACAEPVAWTNQSMDIEPISDALKTARADLHGKIYTRPLYAAPVAAQVQRSLLDDATTLRCQKCGHQNQLFINSSHVVTHFPDGTPRDTRDIQSDPEGILMHDSSEPVRPVAAQISVPDGWKLVPIEPTEEMWGGLARDIVMAWDFSQRTPRQMFDFLNRSGRQIPQWMADEMEMRNLDSLPSKGTRATLIYRAFLEDAPTPSVDGQPKTRNPALEKNQGLIATSTQDHEDAESLRRRVAAVICKADGGDPDKIIWQGNPPEPYGVVLGEYLVQADAAIAAIDAARKEQS